MKENLERNFEWFLKYYDEIYSLYGECYVVIQDNKIIKTFLNELEGYHWIEDNNLLGKANLQYCNGDESGYTITDYTIIMDNEDDAINNPVKFVVNHA